MKNTFNADLPFGKKYEEKLLNYLPNVFSHSYSSGKCKAYDVKVITNEGAEVLYEVKADRFTERTGNICVEFSCRGQKSGITTTEADYYAIFVVQNMKGKENNLYIVETEYIRKLIQDSKYHKIMDCGYEKKSRCYLFSEKLFTSFKE